jgi:hypothetical protein
MALTDAQKLKNLKEGRKNYQDAIDSGNLSPATIKKYRGYIASFDSQIAKLSGTGTTDESPGGTSVEDETTNSGIGYSGVENRGGEEVEVLPPTAEHDPNPVPEATADPEGQVYNTYYIDTNGEVQVGFIVDGVTYADRTLTQKPAVGSIVETEGGTYQITSDGSVKISDSTDYISNYQTGGTETPVEETPVEEVPEIVENPDGTVNVDRGYGGASTKDTEWDTGYEAPANLYDGFDQMETSRPELMDGSALADQFGVTQDMGEIEGILQNAVSKQYDVRGAEMDQNDDRFYDNLARTQNTVMDTLGMNEVNAIKTGASKGMTAANELAAILGMQENSMEGVNELAINRNLMAQEKGADMANASSAALTASNNVGQGLLTGAGNVLNADMLGYGSELNYNSAQENIKGNLKAQDLANQGQIASSKIANPTDPFNDMFGGLEGWEQKFAFYKSLGVSDEVAAKMAGGDTSMFDKSTGTGTGGTGGGNEAEGGGGILDTIKNAGKDALDTIGNTIKGVTEDPSLGKEDYYMHNGQLYQVRVNDAGKKYIETYQGEYKILDEKEQEDIKPRLNSTDWKYSDYTDPQNEIVPSEYRNKVVEEDGKFYPVQYDPKGNSTFIVTDSGEQIPISHYSKNDLLDAPDIEDKSNFNYSDYTKDPTVLDELSEDELKQIIINAQQTK